ncbi:DUF262 domain-containing protein [Cryptosporangium japonicum]|uniref:GmrSD restriction endonucleases N-terminal domain-containing protein n=1 Tax=Cryptosporangium japonicum TaxID=80872 RepID=A0ABN0UMX4_9ACTN
MEEFQIAALRNSSVAYLYQQRQQIELEPVYQRQGGIWTLEKQQLLIDSIINGLDIPKIYFHEFVGRREVDGQRLRYAIIDGKQRMEAIWGFLDGHFPLAEDFVYFEDSSTAMQGKFYEDLKNEFSDVAALFNATTLPVIAIRTDDLEIIEEMFSRLNEAAPLNAAEKRNAFGGPVPSFIRELAKHNFFTQVLWFNNSRYRHYDLAAKFLLWAFEGRVVDVKKIRLDGFALTLKEDPDGEAKARGAYETATSVLDRLVQILVPGDPLTSQVGFVSLLYLLHLTSPDENFTRENFVEFEAARRRNREIAEHDLGQASYDLIEFDQRAQSPNDGSALDLRLSVLRSYFAGEISIPDSWDTE